MAHIIPNVLATPGCGCATCRYIRETSPPAPAVWPWPQSPLLPSQSLRLCPCGVWVTDGIPHTCMWPYEFTCAADVWA